MGIEELGVGFQDGQWSVGMEMWWSRGYVAFEESDTIMMS
jgi:hypothetical protein